MRHTWLSLTCRWGVPHVNPRNLVNNVRESSYGGDEDREPHIEAQPCFPLFVIYFHCSVRTHIPNDSVGARYPGIEEEGQSCRPWKMILPGRKLCTLCYACNWPGLTYRKSFRNNIYTSSTWNQAKEGQESSCMHMCKSLRSRSITSISVV